jgi:integrase
VDLSEETVVLLREHKRQQAEVKMANRPHYRDHGLVFCQAWEQHSSMHAAPGDPLNKMTIGSQLDRLCKAAGVKRITPHGLRHTCATLMLAAGVSPHIVQRRLGHADIKITLGTYAHLLPGQQADAAQRLASQLHG